MCRLTLPANPLGWAVSAFKDDRGVAYTKYRAYMAGDHDLKMATERFKQAFGGRYPRYLV